MANPSGRHFLMVDTILSPGSIDYVHDEWKVDVTVGTLGGVEMGLDNAGIPFTRGGVDAALACLANDSRNGIPGR
jgi:hypothetical protein